MDTKSNPADDSGRKTKTLLRLAALGSLTPSVVLCRRYEQKLRAWERQNSSVRNLLAAPSQSNGSQLNNESLRKLVCEVEVIGNSRLNPDNEDVNRSSTPGAFQSADEYCKRRWRRVQHLSSEF